MRRVLLLLTLLLPAAAHAQTVFAAASLTDALQDVARLWQQAGHPAPRLSFGASSTLARQIDQGAPANLFFSADERWMDYLAKRDRLVPGTRRDLLRNRLVLVVPKAHATTVTLAPGFDLTAFLGPDGRVAVADPKHVPAGIYAEQSLRRLGLWDAASPRLAPTADVRAALLLVERGEAPAGIVYSTDAAASSGVAVAATFPDSSHDPITYPVALLRPDDAASQAFLTFLESAPARAAFARRGFGTE